MILWSNVVAAVALVAVAASWYMIRRTDAPRRPRRRDPHYGDWPPDQMAP